MKVLFFDTETDGLPESFNIDSEEWPHIVQICAIQFDSETEEKTSGFTEIVYPHNYIIPENMIHGISHKEAIEKGIHIENILDVFKKMVDDSDIVIAHNYDFDYNVVTAAYSRALRKSPLIEKISLCTMKSTTNILKIPSSWKGKYKWAKLEELHRYLFNENFDGAHSADADVEATAKCFFELHHRFPNDFLFDVKKYVEFNRKRWK